MHIKADFHSKHLGLKPASAASCNSLLSGHRHTVCREVTLANIITRLFLFFFSICREDSCLTTAPSVTGERGDEETMRARSGHSMLIDQQRRKIYVFAGQRGSKEYLRFVSIINKFIIITVDYRLVGLFFLVLSY